MWVSRYLLASVDLLCRAFRVEFLAVLVFLRKAFPLHEHTQITRVAVRISCRGAVVREQYASFGVVIWACGLDIPGLEGLTLRIRVRNQSEHAES